MGSEDDSTQLVQRLVIKLLKGCSNTFTKNITEDVSFQIYSVITRQSQYDWEWIADSVYCVIYEFLDKFEETPLALLW